MGANKPPRWPGNSLRWEESPAEPLHGTGAGPGPCGLQPPCCPGISLSSGSVLPSPLLLQLLVLTQGGGRRKAAGRQPQGSLRGSQLIPQPHRGTFCPELADVANSAVDIAIHGHPFAGFAAGARSLQWLEQIFRSQVPEHLQKALRPGEKIFRSLLKYFLDFISVVSPWAF